MIVSEAFEGKTYAVLGLARSGLATVDTLVASGAREVKAESVARAWADAMPEMAGIEGGRRATRLMSKLADCMASRVDSRVRSVNQSEANSEVPPAAQTVGGGGGSSIAYQEVASGLRHSAP